MRLTRSSLANPAAVAIVAAVVVLLGIISVFRIPAQLLPQTEKPVVSIGAAWPGASPREIESEITVQIEEVLQGTPNMTEMAAWSMPNFAWLQLEFALETDMTRTLIEIISRLNQLRPLPANAQRPSVSLGEWGDANDQLIEYFVEQLEGDESDLVRNKRYLREVIRPQVASLYGVSQVGMFDTSGNTSDQLQIVIDPYKAAELGIDIARAADRIGRSANISSGVVDVGRRSYTLRVEVTLEFLVRLRDERRFRSESELVRQIRADVLRARRYFDWLEHAVPVAPEDFSLNRVITIENSRGE